MNLVAKKVNSYTDTRTGETWSKVWELQDAGSRKVFGELTWNSGWNASKFSVSIRNPVHPELGLHKHAFFATQTEALSWAREQIHTLPEVTRYAVEAAIQQVRDSRYRDEMSDDFAYSNGKVAGWNRLERELEMMLKELA